MKSLEDLFEHQLKDLYSAETQLIEALPKMAEKAADKYLKNIFERHLEETKEQKNRLKIICETLNITPPWETCNAMKGFIKEAEGFIEDTDDHEIMDIGLIAELQRVEHYEISGYGTAIRYAKELGHRAIAKELQTTLDEEYNADNTLDELAENRRIRKAIDQA